MPSPAPSPREQSILDALAGDGTVSFQGLKRLLGLHPQALSRSLARLRLRGLVVGDDTGYRLAHPALPDAASSASARALLPPIPMERSATLAALLLEQPEAVRLLESALAGRWFRNLRWLGKARMGETLVLAWLVEPEGVVLRLVVEGRHARLEVAEEARDDAPVHAGVHALLPAVAVALARTERIGPVGPGPSAFAALRPLLAA
jgi:DNA-binding Lrp family transcriptional regulator